MSQLSFSCYRCEKMDNIFIIFVHVFGFSGDVGGSPSCHISSTTAPLIRKGTVTPSKRVIGVIVPVTFDKPRRNTHVNYAKLDKYGKDGSS